MNVALASTIATLMLNVSTPKEAIIASARKATPVMDINVNVSDSLKNY